MSRKYPITKSFRFALSGLKSAFTKEPNFRIHVITAILALGAAYFLGLNSIEWLILSITIFLVIIFELLNTMLEAMVNLVSPELNAEAKIAKDVSAAAVLVSAIFSVIVGIVLFAPKLLLLL